MFLSLVNLFMLTDSAMSLFLLNTNCSDFCLAGYYALEECPKKPNLTRSYKCEKCPQNTFTAINNTVQKCHRCSTCQENQVENQSCDYNRDRQCVCQKGYYQENSYSQCKRCVNDCKGNSHCVASCSSFPTTTTTTTFQASKEISSFTTKPNPVIVKEGSSFSMMSFLVILMTLIVTFGLICTRFCLTTSRNVCLRRKKDIELSSKELQPNGIHNIQGRKSPDNIHVCLSSRPDFLSCKNFNNTLQGRTSDPCDASTASSRTRNRQARVPTGPHPRHRPLCHHKGSAAAPLEGVPASVGGARAPAGAGGAGGQHGHRLPGEAVPDAAAVEPAASRHPGGRLLGPAVHGAGRVCPAAAEQPGQHTVVHRGRPASHPACDVTTASQDYGDVGSEHQAVTVERLRGCPCLVECRTTSLPSVLNGSVST